MDQSLNFSEFTSRVTQRVGLLSLAGDAATGVLRDRCAQIVFSLCLLFTLPSLSFAVELTSDTHLATAGYYQLKWHNGDDDVRFEIQEADNPAFNNASQLYLGRDRATVVTGRSDGDYYYRARIIDASGDSGAWSDPVRVEVTHHPLSRAFGFFIVGAIVFLAILIAILAGNRRYHSKESQ